MDIGNHTMDLSRNLCIEKVKKITIHVKEILFNFKYYKYYSIFLTFKYGKYYLVFYSIIYKNTSGIWELRNKEKHIEGNTFLGETSTMLDSAFPNFTPKLRLHKFTRDQLMELHETSTKFKIAF